MAVQKFNGLDHLRALAIVLVFGYHYQLYVFGHPLWIQCFDRFGWTGVDLFFVLSGFLIASQLFAEMLQQKKLAVGDFYLKRLFRIIPLYLVILAIYFCCPAFRERERLLPVWRYLTFTQNFGFNLREYGTFSHSWSLCVEEHFYLLLPLVLSLLIFCKALRRSYWLLIGLFVAVCALRVYSWYELFLPQANPDDGTAPWPKYIYYPTYTRLDGLLVGISIAALYCFRPKTWQSLSRYGPLFLLAGATLLAVAFCCCAELGSYGVSVLGFPLVAIGYGFLVMGAISPNTFLYTRSSKITTLLATLSYAVYLSHKGIIHVVQHQFSRLGLDINGNLVLVLCILSCIVTAWILNRLIERPFIQLRKKIIGNRPINNMG